MIETDGKWLQRAARFCQLLGFLRNFRVVVEARILCKKLAQSPLCLVKMLSIYRGVEIGQGFKRKYFLLKEKYLIEILHEIFPNLLNLSLNLLARI
jgi:hypothetical protein